MGDRRARARAIAGVAAAAAAVAAWPAGMARAAAPRWTELTSEHFVLRTELPASDAEELIRTLEESRAAMLAMIWGGAPGPPWRLRVIALDSVGAVEQLSRHTADGMYVARRCFPPTIVVGASRDARWSTAKHELAHHLGHWFLPVLPRWYDEGLASFLGTLRYDRREERAYVGEPDLELQKVLQWQGPVTKQQLFGGPPLPRDAFRVEASAWALVHMLISRRTDAFQRFQRRLGALEPQEKAWAAEFPDLDAAALQAALARYPAVGAHVIPPQHLARWRGQIETRVLSAAEVHAVWAYLRVFVKPGNRPGDGEAVRKDLAAALAADPTLLEALALQLYETDLADDTRAGEIAALAVKAHPDSWLAWLMEADGGEPGRREPALSRALALAPNQPEVLTDLAAVKALQNQWGAALELTTKALSLRDVTPDLLTLHMAVLAFAGKCQEYGAWSAALAASLPAEKAQIVAATQRPLQGVCALGAAVPRCPPPSTGQGQPPVLEPALPRRSSGLVTRDYWAEVLELINRSGRWDNPVGIWRLIDPDAWLYGGPVDTILQITADDTGRVQNVCLEQPSGVEVIDRTQYATFKALAGPVPVPDPAQLKGSRRFTLRIPLGFTLNGDEGDDATQDDR